MTQLTARQVAKFLTNIDQVDDAESCWEWNGSLFAGGYGQYSVRLETGERKNLYAHRVAYEMFVGPIPDGLVLDHLCRNRRCCRPDHLEPVTSAENTRRAPDRAGVKLGKRKPREQQEVTVIVTIKVKTKTYAFSLYPDDMSVVETLAADSFRYNISEAMRHVIRDYRERHDADAQLDAPAES